MGKIKTYNKLTKKERSMAHIIAGMRQKYIHDGRKYFIKRHKHKEPYASGIWTVINLDTKEKYKVILEKGDEFYWTFDKMN